MSKSPVPFAPDTLETIQRAFRFARDRRHDVVGLEHLLLAILDEPAARRILVACGVNLEPLMRELHEALEKAFQALQLATGTIAQKGLADPEEAGAAASEYLRLLGMVALGYCFGKTAVLAHAKLAEGSDEADFYQAKIVTARFFFDRLLPPASALVLAIKRGKASMMELPADAF